jgi:hypothetical protein
MSKKAGGPAFPTNSTHNDEYYGGLGMTLRDYFAAKAMQGFCSPTADDGPFDNWNFSYLAKSAYEAADAMIAERDKDDN